LPSVLHEKLCCKGVAWLKRNGFGVASLNVWGAGSRERVDCIGFRQQCSALIEVKVSRSDFLADMNKPERQSGGVGTYRFYLAPTGLLRVNDLPEKWGLIEASGRSLKLTYGPKGNFWPSFENAQDSGWKEFAHSPCNDSERFLLYCIASKGYVLILEIKFRLFAAFFLA
jgi:hypothetical protein